MDTLKYLSKWKSFTRETSLITTTSSPRSMGSFLKNQFLDVWLVRVAIGALVLGLVFLFKLLLDSQPGLIPVDFRIGSLNPSAESAAEDCLKGCTNPSDPNATRLPPSIFPNSYLPCKDYIKPGSSTHDLSNVSKFFHTAVEDSELLHAAQDAATQPLPSGKPRIAFLFITRASIPHEALWERFFAGADEESYSIYTHNSSVLGVDYSNTSVFYNRSIPTKNTWRFTITLVDVFRRLMAFALLDTAKANMWFVLLSETCIPVRSFPYVYDYFMNSTTSFVEGFSPQERFLKYEKWEPVVEKKDVRKGELWMSMHRRHAGMVVGDVTFYRKFKLDCHTECVKDEMFAQTLLHVKDPQGIANRSVTYADWHYNHRGSPRLHTAQLINSTLFTKIQNRTENLDGQYWDSTDEWDHKLLRDCVYNGRPHSPCFLFARKFSGEKEDVQALLNIPKAVMGY
ncbi:hypothetical protein M758_N012000 [Ceratodon purpureus]|nr:hypothetical protein M758_N012000 [Ceratodon purpureus]KAG0504870.1 hypothetical protein M758_N012000 [Ceratodon purpureus]KAG0504872.1 hypothetical protein M758_N012000 [Ceratodon purpureus]